MFASKNAADTKFSAAESPAKPDYTYLKFIPANIAAIANFNGISNKQVKKSVEGITMEFEMQKLAKVLKTKILL